MRLWSIHPKYLDGKGLVALWREGLMAQKVLFGDLKGYQNHPQLVRFNATENPIGAIGSYLQCVVDEADNRGYHFNKSKITEQRMAVKMPVTSGQLDYEVSHLLSKFQKRAPDLYLQLKAMTIIEVHPQLFEVEGLIEDWEVVKP